MTTTMPTTAWKVDRIEQDAWAAKVTLQRVTWSQTDATDEEIEQGAAEGYDVEPGTPTAAWIPDGVFCTLTFGSDAAASFTIGQHLVLGLTEIREAELLEA